MNSSSYQLDGVLGVVFGLETTHRDGPQARFWVEQGGTTPLRLEGKYATLTRSVVIDART
jgi:hypothetical protein